MTSASRQSQQGPPVALITGAGSGIGRAVCILLAGEGFRVALLGRSARTLDETLAEVGRAIPTKSDALKLVADVARPEQARSAIEKTLAAWGRLDVLVNNAGAVESVPIDKTTQELLDRMFAANAFGPAHLVARAWPAFLAQGAGCVINISSMSTVDPFAGLSAYAAAKSAIESLTRSIMSEGRQHGIRAFTVAPGAVETAMLRGLVSERELPADRTLDPREVAQVVVDCVLGRRDAELGRVIHLPSP